ncbi:MAG: hypothetical protein NZ534_06435, partial [Bacteroidia bacterium]|nr:hypothetical protein [Bacteroidia bacterium]
RSAEAGVKFLLFGAATSAVFLYGWSWYFGQTGALVLNAQNAGLPAAALLTVGLWMKIGAFPLHFWAPDVYESGPAPTLAALAGPSKLAGFVLLYRIFPSPSAEIQTALLTAGACSMLLGNLAALRQTHFRRLIGYSSIAHTGPALLVAAGGAIGAALYYLALYGAINLLALTMAGFQERRTGGETLEEWKGTGADTIATIGWPATAAALAGLPLTAGFAAKVYAFVSLWRDLGPFWTVFALLNAVVGLYVYFRAPYRIFLESNENFRAIHSPSRAYRALIVVFTAVVVFLGFYGYGGQW